MDTILLKIFATGLTLSQAATAPDAIKTQFDRDRDQQEVVELLRAGCAHMRKAFDVEDINIDDLIATAMDDPDAMTAGVPVFKGINFGDLHLAYRQFCKNETVAKPAVDIGDVIDFYNKAVADLPDHGKLKGMRLPGVTTVLDGKGEAFAEVFEHDQRRIWVPLSDVPPHVQKAFIAAEDKRFREHKGIDARALIRAFIGNLARSGRPQGGSTITQQVAKNLLVGDDITYERKMREMIAAARIERTLTKAEILELYLNSTYLGRGSWGIEMAARSYFGKPAKALTLAEGALLAALTKGPNYFNPDRHPARVQERLAYVLTRMQEDGAIGADQAKKAQASLPAMVAYERPRRDTGFHFVDQVAREARAAAGIKTLTADSYTVRSTIHPQLQRATEAALQEGLARYEMDGGRAHFHAAEANLADAIRRIEAAHKRQDKPAWQLALASARLPLYDVQWPAAVVIEARGGITRVGLADGRVLPLGAARSSVMRVLKLHDVVLVRVVEARGKGARAELRVRPAVQGAAVVLENRTGRILAMAGGFSYPLSQLNRATQSQRQPGSALKPLTYLAALQRGLQPNTYVRDEPLTLPPIGSSSILAAEGHYWTPKNYDGGSSGVTTLRRALENSKNLATVNLLEGGIETSPEGSLDRICALAVEAQIYRECERYYPFVLGAQPVRVVDLAAFYAAIASEGLRPSPHVIETIERSGATVYRHDQASSAQIGSADRVSFYQLKTMLQGVLARGTARAMAPLAPYVAGKTGTTDGENDAWFVGFTNDVTVAVWVGYDNADGKRRTLGGGRTGASVALPIFEPIIQATWAHHAPRAVLSPPSPQAKPFLVARAGDAGLIDDETQSRGRGVVEYFRRDASGQAVDTRYDLVPSGGVYSQHDTWRGGDDAFPLFRNNGGYYGGQGRDSWRGPWDYRQQRPQPQPQPWGGLFGWQPRYR